MIKHSTSPADPMQPRVRSGPKVVTTSLAAFRAVVESPTVDEAAMTSARATVNDATRALAAQQGSSDVPGPGRPRRPPLTLAKVLEAPYRDLMADRANGGRPAGKVWLLAGVFTAVTALLGGLAVDDTVGLAGAAALGAGIIAGMQLSNGLRLFVSWAKGTTLAPEPALASGAT